MATEVMALARAAFDPTDEFGTEILHLIVTGQVLQGMLARRDLRGPSPVSGSLILLDTSALVYRLADMGPRLKLLDEILQKSHEANCDIVVTQAVIDEWARLWRAADKEAESLANLSTGLPSRSWRLLRNPVLRSWLSGVDEKPVLTWPEFQKRYAHIDSWLTAHGVRIIQNSEANSDLVEQIRLELVRLSDAAAAPLRTATTALTDAFSAALVAVAREQHPAPVPLSWFIAQDRLTNRAYALVRPADRFPVSSTVESWLLLLSATRPYDPAHARNLAEILGQSVILNSFLAVSAGYTVGDLEEIIELLTQQNSADPDELAEQLRTDFLAQANLDSADGPAKLLRHRALRRECRAQSKYDQAAAAEERTAERESERHQRAAEREELNRLQLTSQRWRRGCGLLGSLALIGLGIVLSAFMGVPLWVVIGAALGWAAIGLEGLRWLMNPTAKALGFVLAVGATIAWTVLGSVLAIILSQSAATPAPSNTKALAVVSLARSAAGRNG